MPNIGDKIRFLDSVGGGIVTRVDEKRHLVYVETEDGFEIPTVESQCVVVTAAQTKTLSATSAPSNFLAQTKADADIPARILRANGKKEAKKQDIIEIDLHIDKLIHSWQEMQPADVLDYQMKTFRMAMRENWRHKGHKLVFIHGRGKGVLKHEIESALTKEFPNCEFHDASFAQYEFGAIMVIIP